MVVRRRSLSDLVLLRLRARLPACRRRLRHTAATSCAAGAGGVTTSPAMAGPAGPAGWQAVTQALAKALSPAGLDLVHPLRAGWWARAAEQAGRPELALPHPPGALMVLVGNSRALWAPFCAAFAAGRLDRGRPLDDYVEGVLREAVDALPGPTGDDAVKTYLTTEQYGLGPAGSNKSYVPFQRIAATAGLAELVEAVHLR